jgi:hypothetical protein
MQIVAPYLLFGTYGLIAMRFVIIVIPCYP